MRDSGVKIYIFCRKTFTFRKDSKYNKTVTLMNNNTQYKVIVFLMSGINIIYVRHIYTGLEIFTYILH